MSKSFLFGVFLILAGCAIVAYSSYLYGKRAGGREMKDFVLHEVAKYQNKKGDSAIVSNFPSIELDSCHNLTLHWQIMKDCDSIRGKNNVLTYFKKNGDVITIDAKGDTVFANYRNIIH
jgi:hypothetical protein